MSSFVPKTIMISGATGGIGSALAELYAGPGKTLILTGRHVERLEGISNLCQSKGAKVFTKAFDITDNRALVAWLGQIMEMTAIDLVIANAGISAGVNGQHESLQMISDVMLVNLHSVIHTIYPIVEQMRQRKTGQVAIMSSLAAFRGLPHSPAYCASKAAVKVYGESLRAALKKEGISVSVICPGFIKTAMSDKLSGPKPFLLSANKGARIIKNKLEKKCCQIAFPLPLTWALRFLSLLPKRLADSLLLRIYSFENER